MTDDKELSLVIMLALTRHLVDLCMKGRRRDSLAIEWLLGAISALEAAGLHGAAQQLSTDGATLLASRDYTNAALVVSQSEDSQNTIKEDEDGSSIRDQD